MKPRPTFVAEAQVFHQLTSLGLVLFLTQTRKLGLIVTLKKLPQKTFQSTRANFNPMFLILSFIFQFQNATNCQQKLRVA